MSRTRVRVDGAQRFVRYAYPPNERGSCGPDDFHTLFEYGVSGVTDPGLRDLATRFSGAWPYLELIAREAGIRDALDDRVVEAYWLGSPLLDAIDIGAFGASVDERFRRRTGRSWVRLSSLVEGAVPSHAFHVFAVYPWVGLLAADRGPDPLAILEGCRIRWGRVVAVLGDGAMVESPRLEWDGVRLSIGRPRAQHVRLGIDGRGFLEEVVPGDWVSLHWDWICDRIDRRKLQMLRSSTIRQLALTNERLASPELILA